MLLYHKEWGLYKNLFCCRGVMHEENNKNVKNDPHILLRLFILWK